MYYNDAYVGLSLDGKVIAVEEDRIKIHLDIDEKQDLEEAAWFRFNTSYTAAGHTGFYLMPEKGESIKLYIPESDEDNAFARIINRTDGETNEKTGNTNYSYLENPQGKELIMSPDQLKLTAIAGQMFIKMTENEGIEVKSNKDIAISSSGSVVISANNVSITSESKINTEVGDCSMSMDDITHFNGSIMRMNGSVKR